ncbi:hypothetical protein [Lacimicrobium alkaliphilum]|uniref:Uncharacterized protein n=1 Tax=Lacimicrobium alkaliphilum TaxID=1526571 RepID=A0ABQ1RP74_9ALTE|nr:hypothetical protein [Lacimicrobium alkaliphilum]GGD73509.1 hypothetical protein GCM10011357_30750 [Lacimicrobium alkaliphilum]
MTDESLEPESQYIDKPIDFIELPLRDGGMKYRFNSAEELKSFIHQEYEFWSWLQTEGQPLDEFCKQLYAGLSTS